MIRQLDRTTCSPGLKLTGLRRAPHSTRRNSQLSNPCFPPTRRSITTAVSASPPLSAPAENEGQQAEIVRDQGDASTSGRTALVEPAPPPAPTPDPKAMLSQILAFLGPAALIPMLEPLQNLIETYFIANFSPNQLLEMACLGPSSTITAFNMYAFASLSVAVLIACSRALKTGDLAQGSQLLSSAQALGLGIGVVVAAAVYTFAEGILGALGVSAALLDPTAAYLRCRLVGFPIQIFNSVTVAGLLAQKDVFPALWATLGCLAVMGVAQATLTAHLGLGLQGSAAAIVTAQAALSLLLTLALKRQNKLVPHLAKAQMGNVATLAKALGLLALVYILKNFCYIVMSSAAAAFPPLQAAAHQALWSFWNWTAFIMTSSEQAFYTFVPAVQSPAEEFMLLKILIRVALCVGAFSSLLCGSFGLYGIRLMTPEASLYPLVGQMTPCAILALVGCCLDVIGTGMLLAKDKVHRVVLNFAIVFGATVSFVTAGKVLGWGMFTVWGAVATFFMLRGLLAFPQMMALFFFPLKRAVEGAEGDARKPHVVGEASEGKGNSGGQRRAAPA